MLLRLFLTLKDANPVRYMKEFWDPLLKEANLCRQNVTIELKKLDVLESGSGMQVLTATKNTCSQMSSHK